MQTLITNGCGLEGSNSSGAASGNAESDAFLQTLIENGANTESTTAEYHETSLHLAARYQRTNAARLLLKAGANPEARDTWGRTPLHTAVAADAQGVISLLLNDAHLNLNAKMNDESTPLIVAVRLDIQATVEELIKRDADINAADHKGELL